MFGGPGPGPGPGPAPGPAKLLPGGALPPVPVLLLFRDPTLKSLNSKCLIILNDQIEQHKGRTLDTVTKS